MSYLRLSLAIDDQETSERWKAAIAYRLQALANQVAGSTGPLEVREDWPDLEGWPQVVDPWTGPLPWEGGLPPTVPVPGPPDQEET